VVGANHLTGANAGGACRLQIRALRAARIAQFCCSAAVNLNLAKNYPSRVS
jgi:hypothetical protein